MTRNVFGWHYPPGAENDPNAPWNQKETMVKICYYRKYKRIPYHIVDEEFAGNELESDIAEELAIENHPADWKADDRVSVKTWIGEDEYEFRVVNINHEFGVERS